jgi:hypothetical protein
MVVARNIESSSTRRETTDATTQETNTDGKAQNKGTREPAHLGRLRLLGVTSVPVCQHTKRNAVCSGR